MTPANFISTVYCSGPDMNSLVCSSNAPTSSTTPVAAVYHRSQYLPLFYLVVVLAAVAVIAWVWCRWGIAAWAVKREKLAIVASQNQAAIYRHEEELTKISARERINFYGPSGPPPPTRQVLE